MKDDREYPSAKSMWKNILIVILTFTVAAGISKLLTYILLNVNTFIFGG